MKIQITQGEKKGKLTVLKEGNKLILPCGQITRTVLCKCDCGNTKQIRLLHFIRNRTISCGCLIKTQNGKSHEPLFKKWKGIKDRCSEKHIDKHIYFDRGIKMCLEWSNDYYSFKVWCLNNGYNKNLVIDRIDNNIGYSPEKCRFVTPKINANNKRNTFYVNYKNENIPLKLLLERINKENIYYQILSRIKRGWEHNKAIDSPIKKGNYKRNAR